MSPVRIDRGAVEDFGQTRATASVHVVRQSGGREPADLGDLAVAGALTHIEGVDAEDGDVIAGKESLVGMDRDQARRPARDQTGLFAQFAHHGGVRRLAPIHPAARQPPALEIGVPHHQHPPLRIHRHRPHAQRLAPRQPRPGEEEGAGEGFDVDAPGHGEIYRERITSKLLR